MKKSLIISALIIAFSSCKKDEPLCKTIESKVIKSGKFYLIASDDWLVVSETEYKGTNIGDIKCR